MTPIPIPAAGATCVKAMSVSRNPTNGAHDGDNPAIMTKVTDRFLYGRLPAEVRSAAGVKGVLIRTLGGAPLFRVYDGPKRFTDYEIRHDDLGVTIDADELAAFYKVGERHILDHGPQVLALRKIHER